MNFRSIIIKVLQIGLLAIIAFFVFIYLREQWYTLQEERLEINWGMLVVSQFGTAVGMGIFPFCAWLSLAYLGEKRPKSEIWYFFYLSGIAKYLPGSVWALPGRVYLYQSADIPLRISTVALSWEVLIMILSAASVSLLGLRLAADYVSSLVMFILGGLIIFIIVSFLIFLRWELGLQLGKLPMPQRFRQIILNRDNYLKPTAVTTIFLVYIAAWFILGLSFTGIVYALNPQFELWWYLDLTGVFAGAWIAGFLAIFAPGGIGVRDVLIGLGLSVFLSTPVPFAVTILSRITWTAAEIIGVVLSSLIYAQQLHTTKYKASR